MCFVCVLFMLLFCVFSIDLLLLLVKYLVWAVILFGVHFVWGGLDVCNSLGDCSGFFWQVIFWFQFRLWIGLFFWCWVMGLSREVLGLGDSFVFLQEVFNSGFSCGSVNLFKWIGMFWFLIMLDWLCLDWDFWSISINNVPQITHLEFLKEY